jgi:hypothetical protein
LSQGKGAAVALKKEAKAMSMVHDQTGGTRCANGTSGQVAVLLLMLICACRLNAQLSTEDMNTLLARQKKEANPHELSVAMSGIENDLREGPEANKLPGILQALKLAAFIYRTRDVSVPIERMIGRWPDFDATKLGGKPIFAGTDPQSITDPRVRATYEQALADHEKFLGRVSVEMYKLQEGDYCAGAALRVVESSANPAVLKEAVAKQIASLPDAPWIRERLTRVVLPVTSSKGSRAAENRPTHPAK